MAKTTKTGKKPTINGYQWKYAHDKTLISVSVSKFPDTLIKEGSENYEYLLSSEKDLALIGGKDMVESERFINFGKHKGYELVVKDGDGTKIISRVIAVDKTLYHLWAGFDAKDAESEKLAWSAFDSFKVLGEENEIVTVPPKN